MVREVPLSTLKAWSHTLHVPERRRREFKFRSSLVWRKSSRENRICHELTDCKFDTEYFLNNIQAFTSPMFLIYFYIKLTRKHWHMSRYVSLSKDLGITLASCNNFNKPSRNLLIIIVFITIKIISRKQKSVRFIH